MAIDLSLLRCALTLAEHRSFAPATQEFHYRFTDCFRLAEQRATRLQCWFEPFVKLRAPKMFNLRRDPFERADENSNTYWDWMISHAYVIYAMQGLVGRQIENFVKYPPRQKAGAFNLDEVMRNLQEAGGGANH
jgi:hypothetical protein